MDQTELILSEAFSSDMKLQMRTAFLFRILLTFLLWTTLPTMPNYVAYTFMAAVLQSNIAEILGQRGHSRGGLSPAVTAIYWCKR